MAEHLPLSVDIKNNTRFQKRVSLNICPNTSYIQSFTTRYSLVFLSKLGVSYTTMQSPK